MRKNGEKKLPPKEKFVRTLYLVYMYDFPLL